MQDIEIWKPVVGFEHAYHVSNHGRVKSLPRRIIKTNGTTMFVCGCILNTAFDSKGYPVVSLCNVSYKKVAKVHRLVAEAFCTKPDGCDVVNHLDNSVDNNRHSNLEWTTQAGNIQHRDDQLRGHCHKQRGENNHSSKRTLDEVVHVRSLANTHTRKEIALITGICVKEVGRLLRGERWNFPEAWPN